MSTLIQDLRYGLRTMRRNPGFTAVAVLSLAIGVGANTSVFSVLNAVLLRPLPFQDPGRLVMVNWTDPGDNGQTGVIPFWSYPRFRALRERTRSFEGMAGYSPMSLPLTEAGNPEKLDVEFVTASYLPVLGITPVKGRGFLAEEDRTPGTHPVALVGYGLWQRRFGSSARLIGNTISVNRVPLTVVGILPPGFKGLSGTADVWTTMMMAPAVMRFPGRLDHRDAHWLQVVARLKPGVSAAQAGAECGSAAAEALESAKGAMGRGVRLVSMADANIDPVLRTALLVLFGAVGFVLLIACANIANLLLAKAASREREIALRLALGAGRGRLMRQLLTESVLLAFAGGIAGLVIALWGIDVLSAFKPGNAITFSTRQIEVPGFNPIRLDAAVLAFNFGVALMTGLLFGLLPAWRASRPNLNTALKQSAAAGPGRLNARSVLVSAEVGLAFVLLIGAGLMLRSLAELRWQPLGFDQANVLTLAVDLPMDYDDTARSTFYERLLARASAIPGVESAGIASAAPLMQPVDTALMQRVDASGAREKASSAVSVHAVSPDLFRTLRIPLRRGRAITAQDREGAPWVAVVNETAAKRFWPGQDPIGKRMSLSLWDPGHPAVEVVGVVGDVKYGKIEESVNPDVYLSARQHMAGGLVVLRTAVKPASLAAAVRREVLALDRNVPVYDVQTMEQRIAAATARTRFSASLLAIFAAIALALSAAGIYGVVAYTVQRRVREIGIRVALGASRGDVLRLIVTEGLIFTAFGLTAGFIAALALTRALASQLYGVGTADPLTLCAVALLLTGAALVAAYIPARRAVAVHPVAALRYE